MAVVGEATIKLNFDGKSLKASAEKESANVSSALAKLGSGAKVAGKAIAVGLGVGITVTNALATATSKAAIEAYGEYEQLAGGMQKIFDEVDFNKISEDAQNAFMTMNISANDFMRNLSGVGATFAQTMGDAKGYETAKSGLQTISDYASGTGKSVDTLMEKYQAISRSTSSYLSIADQFAGLLPQTTDGFLKQAQASGYLSKQYTRLNQVPVAEYQEAITKMLADGVEQMGLAGNTAAETEKTITGSLAGLRKAAANLVTGLGDPNANLNQLIDNVVHMAGAVVNNIIPVFERILPALAKVISTGLPKILKKIPPLLKKILPDLIGAAVELLVALVQALPDFIPVIVDGLVMLVQALIPYLPTIIGALVQALIQLVGSLLGSLLNMLVSFLGEIGTKISMALGNFAQSALEGISNFVQGVANFFAGLWQNIVNGAKGAWQGIMNIFSAVASFFGSIFSNAWNAVKAVFSTGGRIFSGIVDGILSAFKAIVNTIIRGINFVVAIPFNGINGLLNGIRGIDILGVKPFEWIGTISVPQIPLLAKGGVTDSASLAMIGEQGKEAVIPLERNTENWAGPLASAIAEQFENMDSAGGREINVYMTNNINNNLDAEEIGRIMMTSIRRAS